MKRISAVKDLVRTFFHSHRTLVFLPMTFFCVFVGAFLVIWALLARNYGVERFKQEFTKAISGLNNLGYDIAYDDISFSAISPFEIVSIKNFKLYRQNGDKFWAWNVPELGVNASLLNYGAFVFYLSDGQSVQIGEKTFPARLESSIAKARFDDKGLYNFLIKLKKFDVEEQFSVKEFNWAIQRDDNEHKYSSKTDIRHVVLNETNSWNMSNVIEEFFIDMDVFGEFKQAQTYRQSLLQWNNNDGRVDVNRLILNWKPLVFVGKGNLIFDKNLKPEMRLVTTSKGLIETMDNMEKAGIFDGKSVLVAKILLSSKMTNLQPEEDPAAIISTFSILPHQLNIENIPMFDLGVDKK